jgi:hypothetical protein
LSPRRARPRGRDVTTERHEDADAEALGDQRGAPVGGGGLRRGAEVELHAVTPSGRRPG